MSCVCTIEERSGVGEEHGTVQKERRDKRDCSLEQQSYRCEASANARATLAGAPGPSDASAAAGASSSNAPVAVQRETTRGAVVPEILPHQSQVRQAYNNHYVQLFVAGLICTNFVVSILEKEVDPFERELQQFPQLWVGLDWMFTSLFVFELLVNMN